MPIKPKPQITQCSYVSMKKIPALLPSASTNILGANCNFAAGLLAMYRITEIAVKYHCYTYVD